MTGLINNCLIALLIFCASFTSVDREEDWKMIKNENGISVYSRLVEGSKFKELRMVGQFKTSISGIIALLRDYDNYPNWVYACNQSKKVEHIDELAEYYYTETNAPWPVSNRDIILLSKVIIMPGSNMVISRSTGTKGMLPVRDGIVRVTDIITNWYLTPKENNEVLIVYELKMDPAGTLPAWVVNMTLDIGPYKTMENMETELKKDIYKNAKYSFLD